VLGGVGAQHKQKLGAGQDNRDFRLSIRFEFVIRFARAWTNRARLEINPALGQELARNVKELLRLDSSLVERLNDILK